jgi:phosphoserine phosphatase RsbU/P
MYFVASKERGVMRNKLELFFEFITIWQDSISDTTSELMMKNAIKFLTKIIPADAGSILLYDQYKKTLIVQEVVGFFPPLYRVPDELKSTKNNLAEHFKSTPIELEGTIFGEVAKTGIPKFVRNLSDEPRLKQNTQNENLKVKSVIVIPVIINKCITGVLSVLRIRRCFFKKDYDDVKEFGRLINLVLDSHYMYTELLEKKEFERDLYIMASYRRRILSGLKPIIQNAELEIMHESLHEAGSDLYEVFKLNDGKFVVAVFDVAGFGIYPTFVLLKIHTMLKLLVFSGQEPAQISACLNREMCDRTDIDMDHYVLMSLMIYDHVSHEIVYSNAGNYPLLLYRKNTDTIEKVNADGLPIGIEADTLYEKKIINVKNGDIIALGTFGFIKAMNNSGDESSFEELYSSERLSEVIRENPDSSAQSIMAEITKSISKRKSPLVTIFDKTLIIMKINDGYNSSNVDGQFQYETYLKYCRKFVSKISSGSEDETN